METTKLTGEAEERLLFMFIVIVLRSDEDFIVHVFEFNHRGSYKNMFSSVRYASFIFVIKYVS